MLLCFSCIVLTLMKVRDELETLKEQIAITDDPKRLSGDTKMFGCSSSILAQYLIWHNKMPVTCSYSSSLFTCRAAEADGGKARRAVLQD